MSKLYFASYKVTVRYDNDEEGTEEGIAVGADYTEVVSRIVGYYGDQFIISIDHVEFLSYDDSGVFDFNNDYKLINLND